VKITRQGLACWALVLFVSGCASPSSSQRLADGSSPPGSTPTGPACASPSGGQRLTDRQALEAAWAALEPNTSSHDQANWQATALKLVEGQAVAGQFEGGSTYGCPGPTPAPNQPIGAACRYWYVVLQPVPVTPRPALGTPAPTAPPLVPEPFARKAELLVEATDGSVVARKLWCVVY